MELCSLDQITWPHRAVVCPNLPGMMQSIRQWASCCSELGRGVLSCAMAPCRRLNAVATVVFKVCPKTRERKALPILPRHVYHATLGFYWESLMSYYSPNKGGTTEVGFLLVFKEPPAPQPAKQQPQRGTCNPRASGQPSGSHPAAIRQPSGSHRAAIGQPSGSRCPGCFLSNVSAIVLISADL